jgi:glyoxylase-like metal-dependent hydrolase (beta-lactamase superfamily II)
MKSFIVAMACLLVGQVASVQGQPAPPPPAAQQEVKVVTTKLGGSVYGIDGQGGRAAALVGPDGIFLVDAQFARVTDKIVAALKELSPSPIKFLVNTHVHGDHTGGNENFAKLGATILGRPSLRAQLLSPRPGPGTGAVPPVAPPAALPFLGHDRSADADDRDGRTEHEGRAGPRPRGRQGRARVPSRHGRDGARSRLDNVARRQERG